MKYFFNVLLLLTLGYSASSQCTYVIDMQDSFGDGWNGGTLDVSINSVFFASYTLPTGTTGQQTFAANNFDLVEFTYTAGGFPTEVSYQVSVGGSQVFADGTPVNTPPNQGLVFSHICGGCDPAGNLTATNVTATDADIAWTSGGGGPISWWIEYGPVGFTPGAGTTVPTAGSPHTLTGLNSSTTYDAYVYSACSSGDTSLPAGPVQFSTLCLPVTVYPFWEGFNSTSPTENCWTINNNNSDFSQWDMDYAFNTFEGDQCAAINTDFNFGANDDYLISPQLTLTGGERIRFKHRCNSTFEPNDFQLLMSTTGINPADFTTVLHVDTSDAVSYEEVVVPLYGITGDVFLAFHIPPGGLDGWVLYIDDILIEQPTVNDCGVSALLQPTLPSNGGFTPVEVEVRNYGISTLNSFNVHWSIGTTVQPTVPYTGPPVALGDATNVLLANLNLPPNALDLKFWTSMPNGVADEDVSNDSLFVTLCPGLAGTYSVGHPSSDFPTAQEALQALYSCGVSGPVVMEFQPGTYNSHWEILNIPGASATNTVTFDGLDKNTTTLSHTGFGIGQAATLLLNGASYFTIKNFNIVSTGTNTAYGVLMTNNAHHNLIEGCNIQVPSAVGLVNVVAVLASAALDEYNGVATEGNNANWNIIRNNDISGGLAAVVLEGGEANVHNMGNQIIDNQIHGAEDYGIYVDEQDSLVISGNTVYDITDNLGDAVMLFDIHNYVVMSNNVTSSDYGIAIFGGFSDPCVNGLVANNMISTSLTSGEALYMNFINLAFVYHNTVRGWRAMYFNDQINIDYRNNIMTTSNGECFYTLDGVSMTAMDYNLYHITGSGNAVRFGTQTFATLAAWQASPVAYDQNSVTGNPGYFNGLHVSGTLPVDAGDPSALAIPVPMDIDGETRPMGSLPDIGADEHIVVANDAMAVGLLEPMGCGNPAANVIIEIANLGSNALLSTPVTVNVTGAGTANYNTTVPLIMPGTTAQINMGPLNTDAGGIFDFEIIVSSPVDGNQTNDTANISVNILPSNQVALSMTGDNLVCQGLRGVFGATASYAPATILWYDAPTGGNLVHVGDGFTSANALMNTTTYYVQVQGCNSPRAIATIDVDTMGIDIDLGPDVAICGGQAATITPTITVSPEISLIWSDGSQTAFLMPTQSGPYWATVVNANGCTDTDTIDVTVSPTPAITALTLTNVSCGGFSDGAIDLDVTGGTGPFVYAWSNNTSNQDLTAVAGGNYLVTVTDQGPAGGCSYVQSFQITEPSILSANFNAVGTSCNGNDGVIDISVSGGAPTYTFLWSNGAITEDINNAAGGNNSVTVTDANGCTFTSTANVAAPTPITVTIDTIFDEILNLAGGINTTATGGNGNLSFTWSNGATTDDVTGLTAGTYSVTVTDLSTGCQQVVNNLVITYKIPDFVNNIPSLDAFKLYPNPTTGKVWVNLTLSETNNVQLDITSVTGQLLQSFAPRETLEQNYEINLSNYPSGVYLARFIVGKEVMTTKIIVE